MALRRPPCRPAWASGHPDLVLGRSPTGSSSVAGQRPDPGVNPSGGSPASIRGWHRPGTGPPRRRRRSAICPASPTAVTPVAGPDRVEPGDHPSLPQTPDPTGTVLSGQVGGGSGTDARPGIRSNPDGVAGPVSSSPGPTTAIGPGSGPASSYPAVPAGIANPQAARPTAGTTTPTSAAQGLSLPAAAGAAGSGPAHPAPPPGSAGPGRFGPAKQRGPRCP